MLLWLFVSQILDRNLTENDVLSGDKNKILLVLFYPKFVYSLLNRKTQLRLKFPTCFVTCVQEIILSPKLNCLVKLMSMAKKLIHYLRLLLFLVMI